MNWFEIWFSDKESILEIMIHNMIDDLEAGYDYFGKSITTQREEINAYKARFDAEIEKLKAMETDKKLIVGVIST